MKVEIDDALLASLLTERITEIVRPALRDICERDMGGSGAKKSAVRIALDAAIAKAIVGLADDVAFVAALRAAIADGALAAAPGLGTRLATAAGKQQALFEGALVARKEGT